MNFSEVLSQMGVLFLLLAIGFIAAKCHILTESSNRMLTKLILYIAQPALMLSSILAARSSVGSDAVVAQAFGFSLLLLGILFVAACALPIALRVPSEDHGVFRFMTFIPNTSFLGYPISDAFFGSTGLFYATLYNIPACIAQYSIGILMIAGKKGGKLDYKKILNPTLITSIFALVLFLLHCSLPAFLLKTASTLGSICTPGSMLVLGASIAMIAPKELLCDGKSYLYAFCNLLVLPFLVWLVLRTFVRDRVLLGILVLMSAMPPAANSTMFSLEYHANVKAASRNVMLSTIFCMLTLPLLAVLLFA